ncbi:NAD(P)-dependent oxidoreductase [Burkholderia cepacia]|uniref:NAD(P)-dependent oxidoreductase n=1 Tax=Burkholderia cepacia TaxID=292 RepID=UPI002AB74575|nr:NAD(P)-dependent oxidoreductase [Burkholderia cepacia]
MKVLCLWHATDDEIDTIRRTLPFGSEVVAPRGEYLSRYESTYSELEAHARDADAFIGWAVPEGILEIAGNLKLLCWLHAGVDDLAQFGLLSQLKQRGVKVANIAGANALAVAEQAMMFVLALAKQTLHKHGAGRESRRLYPVWGEENRSAMLAGRTIGILGTGSIGLRIAKFAKGFDMRVLGVRRNVAERAENVDAMYGLSELRQMLSESDYVVIAAPLTRATNQLIGKAEFDAMKPSAYLVNVSRANIIQERPLYDALTTGRLKGYAADVWWTYEYVRTFPRSLSYPSRMAIEKLPNVLVSMAEAHNADGVLERSIEWGTQSLVEFANGLPLTREVKIERGY